MSHLLVNRRILIADDEQALADSLTRSVQRAFKCDVVTVNSGDAALDSLSQGRFDVFITDMMMPGVHGFDLIEKVKEIYPRVRVIVMTAFPDDFPYVEAIQHGAHAFIVKPCRSEELQAHIIRMIREIALIEESERVKQALEIDLAALRDACTRYELGVEKYKSLFEISMVGNLIANAMSLQIIEANPAFRDMTGYNEEELRQRPLLDIIDPADIDRVTNGLNAFQETSRGMLGDIGVMTADGIRLSVDLGLNFVETSAGSMMLASFRDMSEQHELRQKLVDEASRDALTGLLNKRTFYSRLELALVSAKRSQQPMSLLFIDLDNFKICNDTMGHQTGDDLLKLVAATILKQIRLDRDAPFRFGGDEFAVLLTGIGVDVAQKVGERIRIEFGKHETFGTSMSLGVAEYNENMDVEDFVGSADGALYKAKSLGKNTVSVA